MSRAPGSEELVNAKTLMKGSLHEAIVSGLGGGAPPAVMNHWRDLARGAFVPVGPANTTVYADGWSPGQAISIWIRPSLMWRGQNIQQFLLFECQAYRLRIASDNHDYVFISTS